MDSNTDTGAVTWGKTSWLALIAALAQFAAALVIYLFTDDSQKVAAGAPLLTAASTLYALIKGRMDQASAKTAGAAIVQATTPIITLPKPAVINGATPPEEAPPWRAAADPATQVDDDDSLQADDPPAAAAMVPITESTEVPPDTGDAEAENKEVN